MDLEQQQNAKIKICDMTPDEAREFFCEIAKSGATRALTSIGLNDPAAVEDIKDLRDLLKGYRIIRNSTWTTMLSAAGRIISWIIILSLAGFFLHTDLAKKSVVDIIK